MTTQRLQAKARELHAKTRRQPFGTLAGPLAALFVYTLGISQFPALQTLLHPLFGLALAWSLIGLYFLNRGMWTSTMPADSGLSTGLDFCRREIDRRRTLLGHVLLWSLGPILFALAAFILGLALVATKGRALFPNGLPFLTLVAVWIAAYFLIRMREHRALARELEELNRLEQDNSR